MNKGIQDLSIAYIVEDIVVNKPQVSIDVYNTIHSGVYTRSVFVKKGTIIVGALIKIPTTIIISGNCNVLVGKDVYNINGYDVITAKADRKQVFTAIEDTFITMIFKTDHRDIDSVEKQFTDDYDKLMKQNYKTNITED